MRTTHFAVAGLIALTLAGCSGGGHSLLSPGQPQGGVPGATPGIPILQGDLVQSTLGVFNIEVDLLALDATVTQNHTAAASDNTYELPLVNFMKPSHFQIQGVSKSPTTVDITYTVVHPIPAPTDLDAPPTAANRADLGAVLRVLFLHDVDQADGNTYFAGTDGVVAHTGLVANPHGYFMPKGLVELSGSAIANTFPYRLAVDEAANGGIGNRDGIPGVAGSFGQGNYDPFNGGWQRTNMGADRKGWTGYGMLHQGQSATSTVRINRAALEGGETFRFQTAIVAKYLDPRGGNTGVQRRSNRLPKADGDPIAFAYRMPYGALDCELVRFAGESGGFEPNTISASTLSFHVRDFDANATETTVSDLGQDPNVSMVQRFGSGAPILALDIPGILTTPIDFVAGDLLDDDSAFNGDPEPDSGRAGDELFFQKTIGKSAGSGQVSGFYTGMVRVTDIEELDGNRPDYYFPVDKDLQPLPPAMAPRPVTYQHFNVLVSTPNATPLADASIVGGPTMVPSGGTLQVQVDSYTDFEDDPGTFTVDYDFDGSFFTDITPQVIPTSATFPVVLPGSGPVYNRVSNTQILGTAQVRFTDGFHADQILNLPYIIGPNNIPTADITMANAVVSTFMQLTIDNELDVEGDAVLYDVMWQWDGFEANFVPDAPFINVPRQFAQFATPAPGVLGSYLAGVRIKDALNPNGTIIGVPYQIVPPNTQAELTFSMPNFVMSATSLVLTIASYNDPDGDPVQIKIDWNGDLDFNDAGESGLPPVTFTGQTYTSPVLINNTSANPLPSRTVYVEYTDNISPHPIVQAVAGTYVLGGNRPPEVFGNPILEVDTLAPAATFRVLQNGAFATDPEGNGISWTLRGVPSSGAASNLTYSNFSNMLSNPYMNPPASSVTFTVYANDAFHGTTNGTPFPGTLTGNICNLYQQNYTFDLSAEGWTPGQLFVPALPNTDAIGWSYFAWCDAMGGGMSGNMWTTGADTDEACDFRRNDYGPQLDNNVVSPAFSLVGLTKANAVFNSSKTGRLVTCRYRVYVSTNGGSSWTMLYDTVRTGATSGTLNETNVTVNLDAYVGQPDVRLRFQMVDPSTETFGAAPYAGWSFDAVRITGCP